MGFFSFGKKSRLGIDIGTASIKIAEISKDGNRFHLDNYGIFQLESAGEAVNVSSQNLKGRVAQLSSQDITWAIKQLLKEMGTKTRDVVASIQSFSTFSTIVTMPYLSEQELAQAISFEARKYIPIPMSEVVLDWSIISMSQPAVTGQPPQAGQSKSDITVEVFLVAVPKEETERYQTIMKSAGLNLKALELENSALIRGLIGSDLSPYAIVNIGGRSTSILIVDGGVERVSHNYEVGGFEITKAIAQALNVSLQRAEELKRTFGLKEVDNNMINTVMSSLLDMMVFETKKTITSYQETKQRQMAKILLVGGLANMPRFVEYFSQKLGMPVALGDPLARVSIPTQIEHLKPELNSTFAVSLGLALREI